jgi:UDP-3-O-[3-hydroxymyristoyl] glucosamine N-acyltransferase
MDLSVSQIAQLVGGVVEGDGELRITGVNGVQEAKPGELCFIRSAKYLPLLEESNASATLVSEKPANNKIPAIIVSNPDVAFAMVLQYCSQETILPDQGVHPSVVLAEDVSLGKDVAIDALVRVASGVSIGAGSIVYAGVYIGPGTKIGENVIIYPNVTIGADTEIGDRSIIHAGAVIGGDGFGFTQIDGRWVKIPQVGRVILEDDVDIGTNTAIDRATFGETRVGRGTKIDNLVQIGHNVRIGEDCAITGMSGIAGSTVLGNRVRLGAGSHINGHITIGDDAAVGAGSGVPKSLAPGETVWGYPIALEFGKGRRVATAQARVPELIRRVKKLERELSALRDEIDGETTND